MGYNDWNDLGNDIRRMVDDAVNAGDFRRLDENIRRTVADGLENLGNSLKKGMESMAGEKPGQGQSPRPAAGAPADRRECGQASERGPVLERGPVSGHTAFPGRGSFAGLRSRNPLFAKTIGAQAGGVALTAVGCTIAGGCLIALLVCCIMSFAGLAGTVLAAAAGILGVLLVPAAAAALAGMGFLGRAKRFARYVEALEGRTFCGIEELAERTGRSPRFVRKDVERMIRSRWFRQGHLDRQGTCLIVSEETYRQYLESEKQAELRRQQEQERLSRERREKEELSEEIRKMMETGRSYIEKIERSNDAIPGEEISGKISHMQAIVERIFERLKEKPDCADDLRRFMEYYLPTTVKLLDAYEELDRQPVQGENIRNGKQEIEKTLDTLNLAFEKLLDSLFEDTAWDVAADISVLQTMLAQEGLTEQKLKAEKER